MPDKCASLWRGLQLLHAAAHRLYEASNSHNYVRDISSGALMCPQSASGIAPSTNCLHFNRADGTEETSMQENYERHGMKK